jgi:hypothetical protein
VPVVTCQVGNYTLTWVNGANGATGQGYPMWDCAEDFVKWSTLKIPLALGENRITVTMTDSRDTAQSSVTVTRL